LSSANRSTNNFLQLESAWNWQQNPCNKCHLTLNVLPQYHGKVKRSNFLKITNHTALQRFTNDKNETFYAIQLNRHWYCSIVVKSVHHLFAHIPESVNATHQMHCKWCSGLCRANHSASSALVSKCYAGGHPISHKDQIKVWLVRQQQIWSKEKGVSCSRSRTAICAWGARALPTFGPNYKKPFAVSKNI